MTRRRQHALAEYRDERSNEETSEPRTSDPSRQPVQKPWRVAALLWGFPLLFFIVFAVVKECGQA